MYGSSLSNELKSASKDISNEVNKCYANEEKPSITPCLFVEGGWNYMRGWRFLPKFL